MGGFIGEILPVLCRGKMIMHELSMISSILKSAVKVMEQQGLTRIYSITLKIGAMQDYEEKWLQHYFNYVTPGTPAEGAALHIHKTPIRFRCRACATEFEFDAHGTDDCSCPGCHGFSYDMISGKEFLIEYMEAD